MKVTPDDKFVVISTYMYELAVVELLRNKKFNHTTLVDEVFLKTQRLKSIGGIKVHISDYDFSNDNRFFIVSSEDGSVKVFHNQGNISSSTVLTDFSIKNEISTAEKATLYVDEFHHGKLKGLIALSNEGDIYVCDTDGKQKGMFKKAHDTRIMTLKIMKEGNDYLLVSGSRDGKFHIYRLN
jgi:WD40 repeat protein